MSPRAAGVPVGALGRALSVVLLATALAACSRGPDPAAIPDIERMVEAGDGVGALRLLASARLLGDPRVHVAEASALVIARRFDDAIALLTSRELDPQTRTILLDACVLGAEAAEAEGRLDLARRRAVVCVAAKLERGDLDVVAAALQETPPDFLRLEALFARVREMPPGPEADAAAERLEGLYLALHARETEPVAQERALRSAFLVGGDPEVGRQLADWYLKAGDALAATDPHGAMRWYEHLYFPKVPGLEVEEATLQLAKLRAADAMFPIFLENLRRLYGGKRAEADARSGVWDAARDAFVLPAEARAARGERLTALVYRVADRPRPDDAPDFLAVESTCADATVPCVLPFERVARWVDRISTMERELEQRLGRPLTWPTPGAK